MQGYIPKHSLKKGKSLEEVLRLIIFSFSCLVLTFLEIQVN